MKKLSGVLVCLLLFTFISSARIIEVADAGITDKLRAVIAAKNAGGGGAAASGTYDPTGDGGVMYGDGWWCSFGGQCTTDCWSLLDDGVRSPTAPTGGDDTVLNGGTIDANSYVTDSVTGTITTVRAYFYTDGASGYDGTDDPEVSISTDGSSWESVQTIDAGAAAQ